MLSKYPVRRKIAKNAPYGYYPSKHDPKLLIPNDDELDALEQALKYLNTCSLAEVSTWLSKKTGRYISDVGLMKIRDKRKKDKQREYYLNRVRRERERKASEAEASSAEGTGTQESDREVSTTG